MNALRSFQLLGDRLAGKRLDDVLIPGVPDHLDIPLREWMSGIFPTRFRTDYSEKFAQAVIISLRWRRRGTELYGTTLHRDTPQPDLLTAVDAILQLARDHPGGVTDRTINDLDRLLRYGRSSFKVARSRNGLVHRVDPAIASSFSKTVSASTPNAASMLRHAWHHVYQPNPDPTTAYREAIRAVEAIACPLVLPDADKATLETVITHLRRDAAAWDTTLTGADSLPGGPEPVWQLMTRLWTGQVSRYGGCKNAFDQDQDEAEAAVHAAILLVHWLSTGTLKRRSSPVR
ncbi:hypothetical protein ACIQUM_37470 [Amycolatopsis azurea]|uniref:hypothetical protein n=1 Tax=Amycolatopsis azurea TaxID=36819 RepID=UPI003814342D